MAETRTVPDARRAPGLAIGATLVATLRLVLRRGLILFLLLFVAEFAYEATEFAFRIRFSGLFVPSGTESAVEAELLSAFLYAVILTLPTGAALLLALHAVTSRRASARDIGVLLRSAPFLFLLQLTVEAVLSVSSLPFDTETAGDELFQSLAAPLGLAAVWCVLLLSVSVFSVVEPAILEEARGFDALARSWRMTRGFRGRIVILFLAVLAISIALALLVAPLLQLVWIVYVPFATSSWFLYLGPSGVSTAAGGAVAATFGACLVAVVWTRLRALERGVEDVGAVFD